MKLPRVKNCIVLKMKSLIKLKQKRVARLRKFKNIVCQSSVLNMEGIIPASNPLILQKQPYLQSVFTPTT